MAKESERFLSNTKRIFFTGILLILKVTLSADEVMPCEGHPLERLDKAAGILAPLGSCQLVHASCVALRVMEGRKAATADDHAVLYIRGTLSSSPNRLVTMLYK